MRVQLWKMPRRCLIVPTFSDLFISESCQGNNPSIFFPSSQGKHLNFTWALQQWTLPCYPITKGFIHGHSRICVHSYYRPKCPNLIWGYSFLRESHYQFRKTTLLLFQPVSSPKLSENIAPRMILLKCKSEHNTFPFKSPQCHFIVWDYLAFVWAALALSKYVLAIASSQSRFFPWAAPSPRNFTLVSLCAHGPIREVVFHTTSPEDFIYTDLPLHSGSEYPDRLLHSNCLSLQNLFINSCLCYFLISSLKDWKRLCLSYSLL